MSIVNLITQQVRNVARFGAVAPYALRTIWAFSPVLLLTLAISTILNGFAPTATVVITRYVLDAIVSAVQSGGTPATLTRVLYMVALQFAVAAGFYLVGRMTGYIGAVLARKLSVDMQSHLLERFSRLRMCHFDDPNTYDMATRAMAEVGGNKPLGVVNRLSAIASGIVTFVTLSGVAATFSWGLIPATILLSLPFFLMNIRYGGLAYDLMYSRTHDSRVAGYLTSCMTNRQFIPEIMSFNLWSYLRDTWLGYAGRFVRQDINLARQRTRSEVCVWIVTGVSKAGVTAYIMYSGIVRLPPLTVGEIMMYVGAFTAALNAVGQCLESVSGMYEDSLFLQSLRDFHTLTSQCSDNDNGNPIPETIESIALRHISFRYPGGREYVLKDVSVEFARGCRTLIVGANGAGKTTLIRLLLRLYEPSEGTILINGIDIRKFSIPSLRRGIGVIFQDFIRYALPAKENIGVGAPEAIDDQNRIIEAAKCANVHTTIDALPNGYDTILSSQFRDGHELSLGQWQRVCLARLFFKDSPVLVLDEPSASLDIETEANLLRDIGKMAVDRICVLISHRMFRAGLADRIVVLEHGRVMETGTHDELLRNGGRYAELWRLHTEIRHGRLQHAASYEPYGPGSAGDMH